MENGTAIPGNGGTEQQDSWGLFLMLMALFLSISVTYVLLRSRFRFLPESVVVIIIGKPQFFLSSSSASSSSSSSSSSSTAAPAAAPAAAAAVAAPAQYNGKLGLYSTHHLVFSKRNCFLSLCLSVSLSLDPLALCVDNVGDRVGPSFF